MLRIIIDEGATPMADKPLFAFTSHIDGKNAKVEIWPDRIEWERNAISLGRALNPTVFGIRKKNTDMVPIRQVTSVTSKKGLGVNTVVTVNSAGGSVDFRIGHKDATKARELLNRLILEAGQPTVVQAAAAPSAPVAAAPDVTAQLTQLKGLLDAGVVNQDEYDAKKTELLARL
jgi:hypothetical protein